MSENKFAFVFPGQGSQQVGMGKYFYENFPLAKQTFEQASDAISFDMKKLCFEGSEADLALTENTQPALLCVSTCVQRVLTNEFGLKPAAAAGHSIGEYAALVAAQVMAFDDAIRAVRKRGQAMQAAVPVGEGAMIAVLGLEDNQVEWLCDHVKKSSGLGPISAANFNSPGQVVISGSAKAIAWLKENFKAEEVPGSPRRAKLIPLNVSAPFHCAMMGPAEEQMRSFLDGIRFQDAKFAIYQNHHASAETKAEAIREHLIKQISAPVLWTQSVLKMKQDGFTSFVEVGHGAVLKGLIKKIDADLKVLSTNTAEDLESIRSSLPA